VNKVVALCLFLSISLPVLAIDDGQAMYAGGTIAGLHRGAIGRIDTSSKTALTFEYSGSQLSIPYSAMDSFQYSQEVKRHLGVLPAIAIGLIKQRQRRHLFRISYHDEQNFLQVAIFEVSKRMPGTLETILRARVPARPTPCAVCPPMR
jgi:hypothetical protein